MIYEDFKKEYIRLHNRMFSYSIDQAGSSVYASKLSDLIEIVPAEWEERADEEIIQSGISAA